MSTYKHGVANLDSVEAVEPAKDEACLWNGTSSVPNNFAWEDTSGIKGGLWYSYNDRGENGNSLLYWSAEAPSYKNVVEWLTDKDLFEGGLSASVTLDKGNSTRAYAY